MSGLPGERKEMRHGSLFSGIGGFDLAAEWAGWTNVFQVEKDEWCRKILSQNFPNTIRYGDIKEFYGKEYEYSIDVISGGFPCQPFSTAGSRKGKDDHRYLWPEMLRVITEVKPKWVIGENVAGILSMENGKTIERILSDLENSGYITETFLIPACGIGAWHKRERIWITAYSKSNGCKGGCNESGSIFRSKEEGWVQQLKGKDKSIITNPTGFRSHRDDRKWKDSEQPESRGETFNISNGNGREGLATDTGSKPLQRWIAQGENMQQYEKIRIASFNDHDDWKDLPEPTIFGGNNGISNRVDRTKALGNAIVPQIAYEIFKAINEYERNNGTNSN